MKKYSCYLSRPCLRTDKVCNVKSSSVCNNYWCCRNNLKDPPKKIEGKSIWISTGNLKRLCHLTLLWKQQKYVGRWKKLFDNFKLLVILSLCSMSAAIRKKVLVNFFSSDNKVEMLCSVLNLAVVPVLTLN